MDTTPEPLEEASAKSRPATTGGSDSLYDVWYFALPGARLGRGEMAAKTIAGAPVLLGRDTDGKVFALRDLCPHRGIPLSYGRFDGHEVECCYHGWRFDRTGCCTAIPSLTSDQKINLDRIRTGAYPCREVQGNIWVYLGDGDGIDDSIPQPPVLPDVDERDIHIAETMTFPCDVDHAVVGLMDPAHGPFVHESWWWRSGDSSHEKAKTFEASPFGFTMVRHRPSKNSRAYRLLGGVPETEIRFQLPGVRVEHVRAGRRALVGLTAVTPVGPDETEVNQIMYWTMPWLTPFAPVLRLFARRFLEQDRNVVVMQQDGLRHDPPLMLINDADAQAKWYHQIKTEYARSRAEGRPFENPVRGRTLRWRS